MPTPVGAPDAASEAAQHPLLRFYLENSKQSGFFRSAEGLVTSMDTATLAQMRATYHGMMTEVDDQLGRVFAYLDKTGQWDETLVVFTSDHGEQLGDHHLLGKIGYFDESFRIPLVVKAPGQRGGAIVREPTESIDVMPTLLDWLGAPVVPACDGRSVMGFVRGAPPAHWRAELHYEYDFRDVHYSKPETALGLDRDAASLCVVQDADYKYVHFAALPPLFFDLNTDPHQLRNLAGDPTVAELVRDYAQRALSWRLRHADRTLTHFRATPGGLEDRSIGEKP